MGSNSLPPGNTPPPKPWERVGSSSGPAPFKPPSFGSTSDVVESSGTANPGEIVANAGMNMPANMNSFLRPVPPRPWDQNYGNSYGGYRSGVYSSYGGGLYGNNMYRGYGGPYGGSGMYGGSMYNNSFGAPMGGMGGPYGNQDPNNPYGGSPPSPPSFWMSFLRAMYGVVNFFGRISMLIDQNTQAFHMFMSSLLQLFDRSGVLYGELARFVLRILGIRTKPRKRESGPGEHPTPDVNGQLNIAGPKAPTGSWDSVWGDDGVKGAG